MYTILSRMSYFESVRDRLREEYEEHMEELKNICVVEFQLQVKSSKSTAKEIIQHIDPSAPIPQALEGGDMQGPLYQCILRLSKVDAFQNYCKDNTDIKIYTGFTSFDLEESLYRPEMYVQWEVGKLPTIRYSP